MAASVGAARHRLIGGLLAASGAAFAWAAWPGDPLAPAPLPAAASRPGVDRPHVGCVRDTTTQLARRAAAVDLPAQPGGRLEPAVALCSPEPWCEPMVGLGGGVRGELLVVDGETGAPVVGYGVRCIPHADLRPVGSAAIDALGFALRARSMHGGGMVELHGLTAGQHLLLVEPDDRLTFAPMAPVAFDVCTNFAERLVVQLPRAGQRAVVVVRRDGTPVAGTIVELLLPLAPRAAAELTFATPAWSPRQCLEQGRLPPAMLVQRVATDATGRALLRGARHQRHGLRLLGPGHMPMRIADLWLDDTPLRLEVEAGATLRGRLEPMAGWDALPDRRAGRLASYRPGLQLVDANDAERRLPARRTDSLPLAADGSFCIQGIAPGDWQLLLTRWVFEPDGRETLTTEWLAGIPNLCAGEERVVELLPTRPERGRIEGTLWLGHEPWANARCTWEGVGPDGTVGAPAAIVTTCTDAAGRFGAELAPGWWQAVVVVEAPAGQWRRVRLPGRHEVQRGRTITVELRDLAGGDR